MVGVLVRGRAAWIAAVVLGAILLIVGFAIDQTFLVVVGAAFLVIGIIFLILSLLTRGRTD
ncbi:hypothetical protein [Kocuria rhizosphaericola]|uniref:hypothetical protein n=1 Tax=Kocuria rhizosphaericola TaxID=3376284 RepID=UPI0037996EAB